jgi:hypothetical protein
MTHPTLFVLHDEQGFVFSQNSSLVFLKLFSSRLSSLLKIPLPCCKRSLETKENLVKHRPDQMQWANLRGMPTDKTRMGLTGNGPQPTTNFLGVHVCRSKYAELLYSVLV